MKTKNLTFPSPFIRNKSINAKFDEIQREIDRKIRASLTSFRNDISLHRWIGRENEAISLFAFGFLQKECVDSDFFEDPTQIAIEVAVKPNKGNKVNQIRKDLVIWKEPSMNCFDAKMQPSHDPIAILEWKVRHPQQKIKLDRSVKKDIDWLLEFSSDRTKFVGYSISLDIPIDYRLKCHHIFHGNIKLDWLTL